MHQRKHCGSAGVHLLALQWRMSCSPPRLGRHIPAESGLILPAIRRNARIEARDHRPPPICSGRFSLSGPSPADSPSADECTSENIEAHAAFSGWHCNGLSSSSVVLIIGDPWKLDRSRLPAPKIEHSGSFYAGPSRPVFRGLGSYSAGANAIRRATQVCENDKTARFRTHLNVAPGGAV